MLLSAALFWVMISSNSSVAEALLQSFVREFYAPSLRMTTRLPDSQEKRAQSSHSFVYCHSLEGALGTAVKQAELNSAALKMRGLNHKKGWEVEERGRWPQRVLNQLWLQQGTRQNKGGPCTTEVSLWVVSKHSPRGLAAKDEQLLFYIKENPKNMNIMVLVPNTLRCK